MKDTGATFRWTLVAVIVFAMISDTLASTEEIDRGILMSNFPYARGVRPPTIIIVADKEYYWQNVEYATHSPLDLVDIFFKILSQQFSSKTTDNDVELARILVIPQRMYHPKRNSELINSLLGLPKNMNNAGRK